VFDALLSLPPWIWLITIGFVVVLELLPPSRRSFMEKRLRLQQVALHADKLLQSIGSFELRIFEFQNENLYLDFSHGKLSYQGKKVRWSTPVNQIKSWRVYDSYAVDGYDGDLADWNAEFIDGENVYTLDKKFIENSLSLLLIKAACVRAFGSNKDTVLEGLQQEVAKTNALLLKIDADKSK
jgi:hypothetical protein